MVSIYRPLLEECIGGTDLLSDLGDIIDRDGKQSVRKARQDEGSKRSMEVLLDLMDVCQHNDKWTIFYKALKRNDFEHVITALKDADVPDSVQNLYREVLLRPENIVCIQNALKPKVQKELVDRKLISSEDSQNIISEKEMTGSERAAILVFLDRLWRRNEMSEWVENLSTIFSSLKHNDLSQKLHQTELKTVQVTELQQEEQKLRKTSIELSSMAESRNVQDETEPKRPLEIDTMSSREGACLVMKEKIETETGSELSDLRDDVGISLPSSIFNSETNVADSQSAKSVCSEEVGLVEPTEGEHLREADSGPQAAIGNVSELTTGMVEDIVGELDATVERSRLRIDAELTSSEKDEKDADEATEKEAFPVLVMREYQKELAELAIEGHNTILCAETGTGKTYVALYVTQEHLSNRNDACVVFLARTNALVEQQYEIFTKFLYKYKVYYLKTDKTAAMGRKLAVAKDNHQVFFMTPQILLNNMNSQQISLQDISLLIFDECHHTRKREPYNNVMKQYLTLKRQGKENLPQVLGLTATIGVGKSSTLEGAVSHILSVCASLDVFEISMVRKNREELESHVSIPKRDTLKLMEKEKDEPKQIILDKMQLIELYVSKTEATNQPKLKKHWDKKPKKRDGKGYQKWTTHFRNRVMCKLKTDPKLLRKLHAAMTHLSAYNEALGVNYLMNSTHVAEDLKRKFYDDQQQHLQLAAQDQKTPDDDDVEPRLMRYDEEICQQLEALSGIINPHLKTLRNYLVEVQTDLREDMRGMIFVETRATAFALAQYISEELGLMGYRAAPFTGSKSSDNSEGMQEEEKAETLKRYRKGEINVLVATSVGSEGIDVPDCNFIITYNYTGNEADIMQMSGRARKKGSMVTHISDQTIQRREESSLQKALMMARAFECLDDMRTEDRHRKIQEQQDRIKNADIGSFFIESSIDKVNTSFAIICWKCQKFAVMGSDVRIFTGQHRVVLDLSFQDRCDFEETDETSRFKKRIIRCQGCRTKWGTTFGVDDKEVPVLKVKALLFVPGYTGGDLRDWKERKRFKKWGKVEYDIKKVDKFQLIAIFNQLKKATLPSEREV